jgi:hypothetical protein
MTKPSLKVQVFVGVAGSVIGGLVLNALGLLKPTLRWVWTTARGLAVTVAQWLLAPTQVPRWGVVLFAVLVFILLAIAIRARLRRWAVPPHLSYCSDVFLGVQWRWRYHDDHTIDTESVTPYCPRCEHRMLAYGTAFSVSTSLRCEACSHENQVDVKVEDLQRRIVWNIEHAVNVRRRHLEPS